MYVSTKCLFPNFSLTWLSVINKEELASTKLYPKLTEKIIKELGIEKGIEWSMSAFLLECEGKKALFDAGFFEKNNKGILDRLFELKISPDEIDYIFITHFHWDHIAGLIDDKDNIIYKNAKIYVCKEEYDGWIYKMPAEKNVLQVKIMKIYEKQLVLFDFNDKLPLEITPIKAFGHTPGHTCYRKDDLLIIGDLIHGQKIQFKYPEICATFDGDEKESIESRKKILKFAEEQKLFIAGHHLQYSNFSMYKEFKKK